MKISLIIPVYNEEKIISKTLKKLKIFIESDDDDWEIILVNDGSSDKSLEILNSFKSDSIHILHYKKNKGKGFAIKKGVEKASGDYIGFIDSDLAYSFEDLRNLLSKLKFFEIVIGSRSIDTDNHENIKMSRRVLGRGFSILSNLILKYNIEDTQCGLKVFRKGAAKELFSKQKITGFSFDTEILYLANKKNYSLALEKVVVSKDHLTKNSKVNLLVDPLKMLRDLIKIKINDLFGKYE
jgi:glycosyltransferase involved in cell wall biosynthesis